LKISESLANSTGKALFSSADFTKSDKTLLIQLDESTYSMFVVTKLENTLTIQFDEPSFLQVQLAST